MGNQTSQQQQQQIQQMQQQMQQQKRGNRQPRSTNSNSNSQTLPVKKKKNIVQHLSGSSNPNLNPISPQNSQQPQQQQPQEIPSISLASMSPYDFFQIPKTASLDDLKNAYRRIVLKYHPDRGGDPQIFALVQHYYKELEEEIRRNNEKIYERPVVPQTYDDTINQGQQNIYLETDPKRFDVNKFNQVFSQIQTGIQQETGDPTLQGYGEFMDNTQRRSSDDPIPQGGENFRNFANDEDQQSKDVMVYREPEILYSGQGLSFVELGQSQINDFSGYDSRGNVRFMDYKKAMSNPQEIRAAPRPEYRNVDEYKRARENITPLTEEEKQQQLYKKQQEQQREEERQRKMNENDHIIQRHFQNVNHRFIK